MRVRTLASGSTGNALLVQADELRALVDAGLPITVLDRRLAESGVPLLGLDHVLVTHGHLDHSRSAGRVARRHHALLHAAAGILPHPSLRRARRTAELSPSKTSHLEAPGRAARPVHANAFHVPHDADPTYAISLAHEGRRLAVLTDCGKPVDGLAARLADPHVLVLEFNHDRDLLESGPYPAPLRRRVAGDRGHLSNEQAARWLSELCGPSLHTLVLAHLSTKNNTEALALRAAQERLESLGRSDVRVHVAAPDQPGPWIDV